MTDNKNTILAIALSSLVLIAWQYFYGIPQEKTRQQQLQQQQLKQTAQTTTAQPGQAAQPNQPQPQDVTPPVPGAAQTAAPASLPRADALAASPRVPIDTPSIRGSINLKGARIDDISLVKFRETVDPKSPPVVLLSPSGSPDPFYAEFGWTGAAGSTLKLPNADTLWKQDGSGALSVNHPVTLTYETDGLQFRRTISVDDKYLFTVKDEVANKSSNAVTLYPYGLISRHGTPQTAGYYILHEGLVGYLGKDGLQEYTYKK